MRKYLILILILLTAITIYSVEPLSKSTFFTNEELTKIENGELISRMYVKHNARGENSHDSIKIPRTKYNDEDFSQYEIISDEKGFLPYELNAKKKLEFYNTLCSFSKLEGMKYYSRRAGKVEQLVVKCYRVESLSGKKHSDKKYTQIEPKVKNMFLQKDNKFGELIYQSEIYNEGNNFILANTCLQPISKMFFHINNPEEYKIITFFIYDENKKGYYLYTFQAMRVRSEVVLKKGMVGPTSFSNRLRAGTVHLAKLLNIDWSNKLNSWPGKYDTYKK